MRVGRTPGRSLTPMTTAIEPAASQRSGCNVKHLRNPLRSQGRPTGGECRCLPSHKM